ncbi:WGxxGxxG family protein [Aurantimonas endophytica]|uniref:WGxxGxxG family protein n=1 Tax=Aurantimonas endophytica TaxID=1522175 RepID=UPI001606A559|nr:WGxxGxxG family protein [Aurantimonas endophytica]MCO6404063.1 hypothetical protein [Aurantimonas endophytica]
MHAHPLIVSVFAIGLLAAAGTGALAQATAPDTETVQPTVEVERNDDDEGFDLGWLGLLGLAGLAGLKKPKRETHVVDRTDRPHV